MAQDGLQQLLRRITDLEARYSALAEQVERDRQLLLRQQQRIDELEKHLTQIELEPPTVETLE